MPQIRLIVLKLVAISLLTQLFAGVPASPPDTLVKSNRINLIQLSQRISEPGGYFGSDNLVSNELSLQHVIPKLNQMGVTGGVYLGVGPDQSFTYIAAIKPSKAFMIDIRRDCLLHHLLLKSLFQLSHNRIEYLSLMFARPIPPKSKEWNKKPLKDLVEYIDRTPSDPKLYEKYRAEIKPLIQ